MTSVLSDASTTLATAGLPKDIAARCAYLTPRQKEVLAYRLQGCPWREAKERAEVTSDTLRRWYQRDPAWREVARVVRAHASDAGLTLARAILASAAPLTAQRMVEQAISSDDSARAGQQRQPAREYVLEGAGVVERHPGAIVQVNQVAGADPETLRRLVEALAAQRHAIEAERGRRALDGKETIVDTGLAEASSA